MKKISEIPIAKSASIEDCKFGPRPYIEGEPMVATTMFNAMLLAATAHNVYRWMDGEWRVIHFLPLG